jgi:hypothetical protein
MRIIAAHVLFSVDFVDIPGASCKSFPWHYVFQTAIVQRVCVIWIVYFIAAPDPRSPCDIF